MTVARRILCPLPLGSCVLGLLPCALSLLFGFRGFLLGTLGLGLSCLGLGARLGVGTTQPVTRVDRTRRHS